MIVGGIVTPSITTQCVGRSGRLVPAWPSVPLMSFQVVPPSVVRKTCWVRRPAAVAENPS